jgi:hypothetical protein
MIIKKFSNFVFEKVGISTPSIIFSELIYQLVEEEFIKFKNSSSKKHSDVIKVNYTKLKPYIKDKYEYSKFPVVGMTINVEFDKMPLDKFYNKYSGKETKRKHAIGGWASQFGYKNWKNYSKKVKPIKMVTDHGIIIDLGISISISDDYNIGSYKWKFNTDLGRVIWHELNHLYEDYKRLFSMKGLPIYKRTAAVALSHANENKWKIKNEIFKIWYNDFLYYIYASEPYELNAQVQEIGHFLLNNENPDIKKTQSYQNANYMQNFNPEEFIKKLENVIAIFYPDNIEDIKIRLKNMWVSSYESFLNERGEKPTINLNYLKSLDFSEFVKYFGFRFNKSGNYFKKKIIKTLSYFEEI